MRQFLRYSLSLCLLMLGVVVTHAADTVTIDHNNTATSNVSSNVTCSTVGSTVSKTINGITITFEKHSGNCPGFYTSSGIFRYYKDDIMTISADRTIEKIQFTMNSGSVGTPSTGSVSNNTWTGSAKSIGFTGSATVKVTSFIVTFASETGGGETQEFTSLTVGGITNGGSSAQPVSLTFSSDPTADAIYYNIDGIELTADNCTTAGTLYSSAVTVDAAGDHTVHAVAVKNGYTSKVLVPFTFTILAAGDAPTASIVFKKTTSTSGTAMDTSTKSSTYIEKGAEYISAVSATNKKAYYGEKGGVRIGSSKDPGNLTLDFADAAKIKAGKVRVYIVKNDDNSSITITLKDANGVSKSKNATITADAVIEFTDSDLPSGKLSSITFANSVMKNRYWISQIDIYAAEEGGDPEPVAPTGVNISLSTQANAWDPVTVTIEAIGGDPAPTITYDITSISDDFADQTGVAYNGPITLSVPDEYEIKAYASNAANAATPVTATKEFTIASNPAELPSMTSLSVMTTDVENGGTVTGPVEFLFEVVPSGATVYYTTDGTVLTEANYESIGEQWDGNTITKSAEATYTINAIAIKDGYKPLVMAEAFTFTIAKGDDPTPPTPGGNGIARLISKIGSTYNDNISSIASDGVVNKVATWTSPGFTMTQAQNSANNAVSLAYDEVRIYNGHTLAFTPLVGYHIVKVIATANSDKYATILGNSTKTNCTTNVSGSEVTITPTNGNQEFTLSPAEQSRINYFVVEYALNEVVAPTAVTIALNERANTWERVTVTITADGTNPSIKYSLDGAAEQTYSEPFEVSAIGSHTVSATASNDKGSVDASEQFEITVRPQVAPTGVKFEADRNIDALQHNQTVNITLAVENVVYPEEVTIYYTINGGESQTYTAPIPLDGAGCTYTLRAWAENAAGSSEATPSELVVTFPDAPDLSALTFHPISKPEDIVPGKQYLLVYTGGTTPQAMGKHSGKHYDSISGVTIDNDKNAVVESDKLINGNYNFVVFENSGENLIIRTSIEDKYMHWATSNGTVTLKSTASDATPVKVEYKVEKDNSYHFVAQPVTDTSHSFEYSAGTNQFFGNYKNTQYGFGIYYQGANTSVPTVTISPADGTNIVDGAVVTLAPSSSKVTKIGYTLTHNGYAKATDPVDVTPATPVKITLNGQDGDTFTVSATAYYNDADGNEQAAEAVSASYTMVEGWTFRHVTRMEDIDLGETYIVVYTDEHGINYVMGREVNSGRLQPIKDGVTIRGDIAEEDAANHELNEHLVLDLGTKDEETGTQYYTLKKLSNNEYVAISFSGTGDNRKPEKEFTFGITDPNDDLAQIALQFDAGRGNNLYMPFKLGDYETGSGSSLITHQRALQFNTGGTTGYFGAYDAASGQFKDAQLYVRTLQEVNVPMPIIDPDSKEVEAGASIANVTVSMPAGVTAGTDYSGYYWTTGDVSEIEMREAADEAHVPGTEFTAPANPDAISTFPASVRAIAYLDVTTTGEEGKSVTRRYYSNVAISNYTEKGTKQLILNRFIDNPRLTKDDNLLEHALNTLTVSINGQTNVPAGVKIYYTLDGTKLTNDNYATAGTLYEGQFDTPMLQDEDTGDLLPATKINAIAVYEGEAVEGTTYLSGTRSYEATYQYHHFDNIRDFLAYVDAHDVSHPSVLKPDEFAATNYERTGKDDYRKEHYIINQPLTVTYNASVGYGYAEDVYVRDNTGGLQCYKEYSGPGFVSEYPVGTVVNGLVGYIDFSPRGATRLLITHNHNDVLTFYEGEHKDHFQQEVATKTTTVGKLSTGSNLDNNATPVRLEYIKINGKESVEMPGDESTDFIMYDATGLHSTDTPFKIVLRFNDGGEGGKLIGKETLSKYDAPAAAGIRGMRADAADSDYVLYHINGIAYNNLATNMIYLTEEPEPVEAELSRPFIYTMGQSENTDGTFTTKATFTHPLMDRCTLLYYVDNNAQGDNNLEGKALQSYTEPDHETIHLVDVKHEKDQYLHAFVMLNPDTPDAEVWGPQRMYVEDTWFAPAQPQAIAKLKAEGGEVNVAVSHVSSFKLTGITTDLDSLEAEDAEPEYVYYTLQGLRVERPDAGHVYIRVDADGRNPLKILF